MEEGGASEMYRWDLGPDGRLAALVYALQGFGLFIGITFIIGVIIDYVKRDDVRGTWLESHFRWQIRTFWFALLALVIGAATAIIFIGFIIIAASGVWVIYRVVKGLIYLRDRRRMYPE